MDDRMLRYWIGFNRAKGVGPIRLRALVKHFGSVERAWKASPGDLKHAGLDQRSLHSLLSVRASCDLDKELRAVERAGAWVVTLDDPDYPALLRHVPDGPPVLYGKGTLRESDNCAIAVVGTRRATTYGKTMTQEIVEPLARAGVTIVSGLARGIDAAAHQAAIDAGGRTFAVMASGIDSVYPPEHRDLAEAIAAHGALLTEHPLGEPAEGAHFAPRNRIVSGLSLGVVVIEAGERSGALMTAELALDQGREVFAVPGNALSPTSRGTNNLIQTGARMITSAADIMDELSLAQDYAISLPARREKPETVQPVAARPARKNAAQPESAAEVAILQALSEEAQFIDNLSNRSGLPVSQVSSTLTILELKGLVRQVGVLQYALAGPQPDS